MFIAFHNLLINVNVRGISSTSMDSSAELYFYFTTNIPLYAPASCLLDTLNHLLLPYLSSAGLLFINSLFLLKQCF